MKKIWKFNSKNVLFVLIILHLSLRQRHFDNDCQMFMDDVNLISNENIFKFLVMFN